MQHWSHFYYLFIMIKAFFFFYFGEFFKSIPGDNSFDLNKLNVVTHNVQPVQSQRKKSMMSIP